MRLLKVQDVKNVRRLLTFLAFALLALDVAGYAMLCARSRALDRVEAAQVANFDADVPWSGWQTTTPPVGIDIVAFYDDDFGDGIRNPTTMLGKWTLRGTFDSEYVDNGVVIRRTIATRRPDAWTLGPPSIR